MKKIEKQRKWKHLRDKNIETYNKIRILKEVR